MAFGLSADAQETGESYSNSVTDRPAETELLLDQDVEEVPGGDAAGEENLPALGLGDFVRMILVLGFVIALVYGFFWLLKRLSGMKAEGEDAINLISTRPLKGDAAIHLIETGRRLFLVGSSGSSVNLLAEIDDKESIDEIRLIASRTPKSSGGFSKLLKNHFGGGAVTPKKTKVDDPAGFLQRQKDRLKKL